MSPSTAEYKELVDVLAAAKLWSYWLGMVSAVMAPSAKEAYPISGVSFILIPKDGAAELDRKTLKAFVQYAVTDGQAATEGLYYAKLPRLLQGQ